MTTLGTYFRCTATAATISIQVSIAPHRGGKTNTTGNYAIIMAAVVVRIQVSHPRKDRQGDMKQIFSGPRLQRTKRGALRATWAICVCVCVCASLKKMKQHLLPRQ